MHFIFHFCICFCICLPNFVAALDTICAFQSSVKLFHRHPSSKANKIYPPLVLSCKLLVPDLFQQIVFKLWHLVPLPSVDCRDSQDQPDKHHWEPAPILVSSILILLILKEYGSTTLILPILLNLKIISFSLVKGFEIRKIIFYILYKCIMRVVINLTALNFLPAYLNSSPLQEEVHIFKHIILLSSRELRLLFVSAQWISSDVFVADRLRVLSNFQMLMKFYSFDDILHCFSRSLL